MVRDIARRVVLLNYGTRGKWRGHQLFRRTANIGKRLFAFLDRPVTLSDRNKNNNALTLPESASMQCVYTCICECVTVSRKWLRAVKLNIYNQREREEERTRIEIAPEITSY